MASSGKYSKKAIIGIIGMLVFGTGTMVSAKLLLDCAGCPYYYEKEYGHLNISKWGHGECPPNLIKKFEKPWY